ncbi:MAG: MAPEG family protein [Burkholderiales bacterium]
MSHTILYAALLGLLFVLLSIRTIRLRNRLRVAVGDGGNPQMLRAMRAHSNFAEYVPLCLLLIFWCETHGASALMIHLLGAALLIGRLSHAFGVSQVNENLRFRIFGMVLTFIPILVASLYLLVDYVKRLMA